MVKITKNKKLIIVGDGETAEMAYEYFLNDSEYEVTSFAVNKKYFNKSELCNIPVCILEDIEIKYGTDQYYVFVALASNRLNRDRKKVYDEVKKKGYRFASYVSSDAYVSKSAIIGDNCFILENNVVQHKVKIGNNVTLWSGNHIGHGTIVRDNCFISSHVVISGFCEIKENTFIGVNSSIADYITIEKDNFIALGTVINKNTKEGKIYRGNPSSESSVGSKRYFKVDNN